MSASKTSAKHQITMIIVIMIFSSIVNFSIKAAEKATEQANPSSVVESPSADYVQLIRQWAEVTNFAKNAAEITVDKITHDLEKDPKYKKLNTRDLTSDLKQFFYELFNSQENMVNLAKVYSEYFTLNDMLELIKFYHSPLGQKMIHSHDAILVKSHEIGSELLKKHEQDYMRIVAKYIKQANDKTDLHKK
jgi:hypothetical protein